MNKNLLTILVLGLLCLTNFAAWANQADYEEIENLSIIIDYEYKDFTKNPVNVGGRILLPMREFFETIGAEIKWDEENKEVHASYENNKIFLKIGSNDSIVNGLFKSLDVAPTLINDSTYIPLRFAAESLGYEIIWNSEYNSIYAFSNPEEAQLDEIKDLSIDYASLPDGTSIVDTFSGLGTWYGGIFHGRKTSSGEVYNQDEMTGAHKNLAFGTFVRVTYLRTDKSVIIRINDRGPFVKGRVIDLSKAAAEVVGLVGPDIGEVYVEVLENYY